MSQTAENKAIVGRFFEEFLNARNVAVADEICAAEYLLDFPAAPAPMDREGQRLLSHNPAVFHDGDGHRHPDRQRQCNIVEDVVEADRLGCRSSSAPRVS